MKIFIICILLALPSFAVQLGMSDVSILMPLPTTKDSNFLLSGESEGAFGKLLPFAIFEKLPPIGFANKDDSYKFFRVVGVRIDPCFPEIPPSNKCQAQIRMIWQPVVPLGPALTTLDGAVHTFYNLTNAEFKNLISDLESLKTKKNSKLDGLGINPELLKQGLESDYAKKLFAIILANTGESKLSQVTFMQLSMAVMWIFGGFTVEDSVLTPLEIPRLQNKLRQTYVNKSANPAFFEGGLTPAPVGADTFTLILQNSAQVTIEQKPEIIEGALSAVRIENPLMHTPHSVDCASCHTAQTARAWATENYPELVTLAEPFEFKSVYNLKNQSPNQNLVTRTRAFGYFAKEMAISQRTINETAEVLEKLYPAKR